MKFLPFIWKNLTRNKLRSLLTGAAVALAVALVCLLRTLPGGMELMLEGFASKTRISVTHKGGLVYSMPYAYLQRVAALPGVEAAASWTWFGGAFETDKGQTFPSFAIEPDGLASVWPDWEIAPEAHAAFARTRRGAIVGVATLERYGWAVGDHVSLRSTVYPIELEFEIVGEVGPAGFPIFFLQREYLSQALGALGQGTLDHAGTIWLRADSPHSIDPLLREIDALFRNSSAETTAETERSYLANMFGLLEGFLVLILIITALVALCVGFIAANTAGLTVRERIGEIAVLRTLGFSRRLLLLTLVAETTLLALGAGVLGASGALSLTWWLRASTFAAANGPLGAFVVDARIVAEGVGLALLVGGGAGLIPSLSAIRQNPAESLRRLT